MAGTNSDMANTSERWYRFNMGKLSNTADVIITALHEYAPSAGVPS